jgi:3'-phosphoadenosine 5'-phosphosulfate sulfotransferase (PAPS reductase)/FAD synthetase
MKNLLVSFSGGETSGYLLWWVLRNWKDKFNIKVVFANTGEENEETLEFVERCSKHFQVEVVWVEAVFHKEYRKGTTHKIVDFNTACRDSFLFEAMAEVYGIPNQAYPHCNRELKLAHIQSYIRSIGWKDYYTVIGIRNDEVDRVNKRYKELKLLYPFVTEKPVTKKHVNFWWSQRKTY